MNQTNRLTDSPLNQSTDSATTSANPLDLAQAYSDGTADTWNLGPDDT